MDSLDIEVIKKKIISKVDKSWRGRDRVHLYI